MNHAIVNHAIRIVLLACASLSLWGQDVAAYLKQAEAQVKAGQDRQAAASYQQAGDIYERRGMPGEAAKAYERAADLLTATPAPQPAKTPLTQIAANRPAPTARNGGGGGLDGLYFMTRFWIGSGLETAVYWFHDGTVAKNPIGSAQNLDVPGERAAHPNDIGTYRLQGGQLAFAWPGSKQQARFEPETKGCFGWDAGIFCPVEIFKPGTTLEGTFSGGASVGGGAVMSSTTIAFKRDGAYTRESVGTISTQGRLTAVTGGSVGVERGKYRIDGTALHMLPDGGKETVVSTFPYDDGSTGPTPRSVYFGGGMLKRLK